MRFYRLLLHLYPRTFRQDYARELETTFDREHGDGSPVTRALAAAADVVPNAFAAHWDLLRQDLRYTARTLARSRGFAITAILVVALGVGANTAAFSLADFVLLRPLPFPRPDRLVKIWEHPPGYGQMELSPANYRDWRALNRSFQSMGAYVVSAFNLVGAGAPQRLAGAQLSADLLPVLGLRPQVGRTFSGSPDDDGTVLLSDGLWRGEFGGDPGIVGRTVVLDGAPRVVIGVMPRNFHFPTRDARLWLPLRFTEDDYADRNNNWLHVIGRLRDGVSIDQARADMNGVAAEMERRFPKENEKVGANIYLLQDEFSQQSRLMLFSLCGAAVCILLLACANLANLLVARALARQRELSLRAALGAGRERLVRQVLTESVVLAVFGGAAGIAVAVVALPLLTRLVPTTLPIAEQPTIDLRILAFAALLTGVTGLAFGILPALRAGGRGSGFEALRDGARAGGGRTQRLRSALVVVEVMASVVLLISSGLLVRAMWRLQDVDPGFRTDGVVTLRTALPMPKYATVASRAAFYGRVLDGVRALPGVQDAGYTSFLPMVMGGGIWPVIVNGDEAIRTESHSASLRYVTPGYLDALDVPLLRGRGVDDIDAQDAPKVAVVSASFAQRYWPGLDPLGRTFGFVFDQRTVVGVVADIRVRGLEQQSEPQVYLPYQQVADSSISFYTPQDLAVRTDLPLAAIMPAIRRIVHDVDPQQPISSVQTMANILADQTASRRVQARVLGALALIALLLAGIGIHGVLSFTVSRRAQEIGVRLALGARRGDILRMVLRKGVVLAAMGVLPGVALAYGAGRGLSAMLFGVQPGDPVTFGVAIVLCSAMAIAGSLFPALRAVRVDPISVMRAE
jgi:predicted permease